MGLFQSIGLGGMMGFHLLHHGKTFGLCLPTGGHTSDFCLFDGLGNLGFILAHGNVSILHQLPSVEVQGGLGHEQPLQGHVHLPLQSKHLIGQASWISLGEAWGCGLGQMLSALRVFNTVGREGKWLTWTMLGVSSGVASPWDTCEEVAIGSGMAESVSSRPSRSSALVEHPRLQMVASF